MIINSNLYSQSASGDPISLHFLTIAWIRSLKALARSFTGEHQLSKFVLDDHPPSKMTIPTILTASSSDYSLCLSDLILRPGPGLLDLFATSSNTVNRRPLRWMTVPAISGAFADNDRPER